MDEKIAKTMTAAQDRAVDTLPGAAYSAVVDGKKTTRKKVDDYTKEINNNPRNEGKII